MVIACMPGEFTQDHLINLEKKESIDYPTGCSPVGAAGQNQCLIDGFTWPDNTEYEWSSEGAACKMCNFRYGWGDYDTVPEGYDKSRCQDVGWGSCSATTTGRRCAVRRVNYAGDKASCCLNSKGGNPATISTTGNRNGSSFDWFDVESNTFTCNPEIYSTEKGCSSAEIAGDIAKKCSSRDGFSKIQWEPDDGHCAAYIAGATPEAAKTVLNTALTKAYDQTINIGTTYVENRSYISNLLQHCEAGNSAGVCDAILKKFCSSYSREDVENAYATYIDEGGRVDFSNSRDISEKGKAALNVFKACACHLPEYTYSGWARVGINEINTACDPLCQLGGISQYIKEQPAVCKQNLCIIDDITIDQINSSSGDINFNVVCGSCGDDSSKCRCIFSNIKVFEHNSQVLGNINFHQNCGGNCQMPDPDTPGKFTQINCKTGKPLFNNDSNRNTSNLDNKKSIFKTFIQIFHKVKDLYKKHTFWFIIGGVIFFIFLFIIVWWLYNRESVYNILNHKDFDVDLKDPKNINLVDLFGERIETLTSYY